MLPTYVVFRRLANRNIGQQFELPVVILFFTMHIWPQYQDKSIERLSVLSQTHLLNKYVQSYLEKG